MGVLAWQITTVESISSAGQTKYTAKIQEKNTGLSWTCRGSAHI
jgi:hypothetical protein